MELTSIEKIKKQHPTVEYIDGQLFVDEELLCLEMLTKRMIEDHYEWWTATKGHSSGNPELDYDEKVSGAEYIEYEFFGDYNEAFSQI